MLEVDLGRAACAFNDHDVMARGQVVIGCSHGGNETRLIFEVVAGRHIRHRFAHDNDLRPHVGCGFEQDGVHRRLGGDAAGLRLQRLGSSNLKAMGCDGRVERHVLRLERGHRKAVLGKDAAQACGDEALACARHRALHHDRLGTLVGHAAPFVRCAARVRGFIQTSKHVFS